MEINKWKTKMIKTIIKKDEYGEFIYENIINNFKISKPNYKNMQEIYFYINLYMSNYKNDKQVIYSNLVKSLIKEIDNNEQIILNIQQYVNFINKYRSNQLTKIIIDCSFVIHQLNTHFNIQKRNLLIKQRKWSWVS